MGALAAERIGTEYVDVIGTTRERHGTERLIACCVHEYMRVLYSKGVLDQVKRDIPRMVCTVNGKRVRTVAELRQQVSRVHESYVHAMIPFASQTSMAVPVELLHETFAPNDPRVEDPPFDCVITDARGPLSVEYVVRPDVWSVRVQKKMRVEQRRRSPSPRDDDDDEDRTRDTRTHAPEGEAARPIRQIINVNVIYESLGASVLVYWAPTVPI